MRRALSVLALAFAVSQLSACAMVTTRTTYKVRQRGLTPGAMGPHFIGPALEPGAYAVALSAASDFEPRETDPKSRENGAPGDVVAGKAGRMVFAAGVSKAAEIAATLDLRPGTFATALAADVADESFQNELLVIPGVQARFTLVETTGFRYGLLTELAGMFVPYTRDIDVDIDRFMTNPDMTTSSSHTELHRGVQDSELRVLVRFGPFATFMLGDRLSITAGGIVGNQPTLSGYGTAVEECVLQSGAAFESCSGQTDEDLETIEDVFVFTPFISPSLNLGEHVRVFGQVFGSWYPSKKVKDEVVSGAELGLALRL